jgi:hypothetical protein
MGGGAGWNSRVEETHSILLYYYIIKISPKLELFCFRLVG